MARFYTFVVPFDFSAPAEQALDLAADLAARFGGELVLVHGMQIPIISSPSPAISAGELIESVRVHVTKRLQETLAKRGLKGNVEVRTEDPDQWVPAFCAGLERPLIVMSRHGWSGKHDGIGSAAKRILRASSVPVWLAGGTQGALRKVLASVDVDRASDRVATAAKEVAAEQQAALELVHVRDPRVETGYLSEVGWPPAVAVFDDLRREAEASLKKLAAGLAGGAAQVEARIATGAPAREIAREAEATAADLIVCGKHARSRIETLLLGSTTAELARLWKGHLLVVP